MPSDAAVVMDCRWLGIGGPGRTTEFALRGLALAPPPGRWILWGPEAATTALAWPGAEVRPIAEDPRLLLGQRHAFHIPRGNFYVFMHQQRPLRPLPAVTVVYDTIALRYGTNPALRRVKRQFLRWVGRRSSGILTISEHSKASILRDLEVPERRIEILRFPFDDAFVERVAALRAHVAREEAALFIGGFLAHKNLARLLPAFTATAFCRDGGRLILVAGTPEQAGRLGDGLDDRQRSFVDVRHSSDQADLDRLYASSLILVQPSLEEGFGLPVWEALSSGLTVCVSDGGSLPEVTQGLAQPFPARSIPAMTVAIDQAVDSARRRDERDRVDQTARLRAGAPTIRQFGEQFGTFVEKNRRNTDEHLGGTLQ